jgi:hypothetical protein
MITIFRNALFSCILIMFAHESFAQQIPSVLSTLISEKGLNDELVIVSTLNSEQKLFFWKDTEKNKNGYLTIQVNYEYLHLIEEFLKKANLKTGDVAINTEDLYLGDLKISGLFQEENQRNNMIFTGPRDEHLMLTTWKYKGSGAQILVVEEFFNSTINGTRAILALAKKNGEIDCLWKVSWWTDGYGYEFYVEDKLDTNGNPNRLPEEIIMMASRLKIKY